MSNVRMAEPIFIKTKPYEQRNFAQSEYAKKRCVYVGELISEPKEAGYTVMIFMFMFDWKQAQNRLTSMEFYSLQKHK